jgi:uroporphyrinogen decarboxylase
LEAFLEKTRSVDAPLQVGVFPWGVFGTARDLLGVERLLMSFCDDPEMLLDMMESCVTLWLALYERVAVRVRIDHIHIWEDMSGKQGSMISMRMVEEFMMPQYDRIADFARRHEVPVLSVDSDGRVDELLPVMVRHGVNAFLPFEAQAGNDIEEVRRQFPKLGILGGLDKNALARGKQEIHAELDRAQRMFAASGYVAGFDHSIPPNVSWENYRYFVENLERIIGI